MISLVKARYITVNTVIITLNALFSNHMYSLLMKSESQIQIAAMEKRKRH